jgi:hypothetical protein
MSWWDSAQIVELTVDEHEEQLRRSVDADVSHARVGRS